MLAALQTLAVSLGARVAALLLVVSLAACGQESGPPTVPDEVADRTTAGRADLPGPPPLTLHRPEGDVDLEAWTWCYQDESGAGGCADGRPPDNPPATEAAGPLTFSFPLEGWSFTASFRTPGPYRDCERQLSAPIEAAGDGTYELAALGPAGPWEVQISGNGDEGGDLSTTFRWTTPSDSTVSPAAVGLVGLLGPPSVYEDKDLEAYGPDLYLTGLSDEPTEATAELVLSDGDVSATYPMEASRKDDCPGDGALYFSGQAAAGQAVDLPDLGEPPYSYEVHLVMDGRSYTGTGRWPDDLTPPSSNSLELTWSPPLPAWNGSR